MDLPIKINLPDHYLEDEVRCGYEVSSKLKKIWAVELDLLNELLRVCQKHGIKVQVSYGTLLGAVRHKGFIPWDDDLDVWLPRKEYNKLLAVAQSEFTHPYFFQTAYTDKKYYLPYARLRNSETTGVITGEASPDYNNGIYIDIYVIDGFVKSKLLYYFQLFLRRIAIKSILVYHQHYREVRGKNIFQKMAWVLLHPVSWIIRYEALLRLTDWLTSMYNNVAERYSVVYEMTGRPYHDWITKDEWEETIKLRFENIDVPVSKDYDMVLRRKYGDYMEYPPAEELGKWHEGQIHFEPDIPYKEYFESNI